MTVTVTDIWKNTIGLHVLDDIVEVPYAER